MGDQDKRKLCWNCEGSVLKHLESCPYCGVYLSPSEQDGSHSLLSPPYPSSSSFSKTSTIPKPIYQADAKTESNGPEESSEEESEESPNSILSPLLFLIVGTSFGLFGLSLWLFSEKGRLTLSWNEDWAPVFLLVAVIMLGFGGRSLSRLQDN